MPEQQDSQLKQSKDVEQLLACAKAGKKAKASTNAMTFDAISKELPFVAAAVFVKAWLLFNQGGRGVVEGGEAEEDVIVWDSHYTLHIS